MTTQLKVFLYALAGGGGIAVLLSLLRSRRFMRYLLLSAVSGVAALYAVNAVGMLTSTRLAVNGFTLGVSAMAGPPGVVALLLMDALFKMG